MNEILVLPAGPLADASLAIARASGRARMAAQTSFDSRKIFITRS